MEELCSIFVNSQSVTIDDVRGSIEILQKMTLIDGMIVIMVRFSGRKLVTRSRRDPTTTAMVDAEQAALHSRVMAPMAKRWWQDHDNGPDDPAIGWLPIRQQEQDFFELVGVWFNANRSPSVWSWDPLPFIIWSFWSICKKKANRFVNEVEQQILPANFELIVSLISYHFYTRYSQGPFFDILFCVFSNYYLSCIAPTIIISAIYESKWLIIMFFDICLTYFRLVASTFSYHFYTSHSQTREIYESTFRNFENFTDKPLVSIDAYVLYVNFDNFLYFLFCEVERCGRRMSIFFQKRNCRSGRRCHSFELISVNEQQLNMHRKTITGRENMSLINPSSLYVC